MKQTQTRAKGKESSQSPHYECASHQINNEARQKVIRKAQAIAQSTKTEKPATGDWRADLAVKQKQLAEMQERHEREYAESLKRSEDTPEALAETQRRLDYSLGLAAKYAAPVI